MTTGADHSALVNAILGACGALPGVVLGSNACGLARYPDRRTGRSFAVPYGWPTPGGPDILAAVAPFGRLVAIECKTGGGDLTKEQRACHAALRTVGAVVCVARTVDDAIAALRGVQGGQA